MLSSSKTTPEMPKCYLEGFGPGMDNCVLVYFSIPSLLLIKDLIWMLARCFSQF